MLNGPLIANQLLKLDRAIFIPVEGLMGVTGLGKQFAHFKHILSNDACTILVEILRERTILVEILREASCNVLDKGHHLVHRLLHQL